MIVKISSAAIAEMLAHARTDAPNECCGLLLGRRLVVERIVRAHNLRASPTRFLVDPEDHFAAMRSARTDGIHVIGAYHSHPSSAPEPSASDIAEANSGADFLYVIVSPAAEVGAELRAYFVKNGAVTYADVERC